MAARLSVDHCRVGASVWRWASTHDGEDPEIIFACSGDNLTLEALAAAALLRMEAPVVYNFHGYTPAIKQLLWERPGMTASN